MKRAWEWLRSDTGRAVTVALLPVILIGCALTAHGTTRWLTGGIGLAVLYAGWELYL